MMSQVNVNKAHNRGGVGVQTVFVDLVAGALRQTTKIINSVEPGHLARRDPNVCLQSGILMLSHV